MQFRLSLSLALLFINTACSTVMEGRTQVIAVDTYPSGAECLVKDNDLVLAKVHSPGQAVIEKSKNDILVECSKDGYIPSKKRNRSDVAITSVANMAFGQWSFVGNMVDSATGASHKYDSKVFMALSPLPPVAIIGDDEVAGSVQFGPNEVASAALAPDITRLLHAKGAIVTEQPLDEVLRKLAANQPIPHSQIAQAEEQEVAGLQPVSIAHQAE